MLLPGIVFDKKGGRIGYGGGYYDRYLQELEAAGREQPYLVGICFHRQLWKGRLPMEEWDRRMDCIVTEKGIIAAKKEPHRLDWLYEVAGEIIGGVLELILELLN